MIYTFNFKPISWHFVCNSRVDWLFSHLYIQKVHLSLMNFYPRNISSKMQLKKFKTRRESLLFFLAHHFHTRTRREMHGHSVCELLTTRSCIRCTRCIHTHTHIRITHRTISSHTTPTSMRSFPTDGTNAFSQLDVRIRSAHLRPHAKFALQTSSRLNVIKIIEYTMQLYGRNIFKMLQRRKQIQNFRDKTDSLKIVLLLMLEKDYLDWVILT